MNDRNKARAIAMTPVFDPVRGALAQTFGWAPEWLVGLLLLLFAAAVALVVHALTERLLEPVLGRAGPFAATLFARTRGITRLAFVILACRIALASAPFGGATREALARLLTLAFIALLGWAAVLALDIAADLYLRRRRLEADGALAARKHLTQVRILKRSATTLIVVITIAAGLMTFDAVRQYGVSLFASAGAAGLVVGLAARPLLTNLIAGVQIAITQPIRLDDTVTVEGETGQIEEITSTYVVVRLWDGRRLIAPLSTFIEKSFQNWSRQGAMLLGRITLSVDPAAPVARIREKFEEIVRASALWDGKVCSLQVSDCRDSSVELTAVVSARDAAASGDLRAEVREKLVAFLHREMPEALPRARTEVAASAAAASSPPVRDPS